MKKVIRQRTDIVGHLPENLKPKEPSAIETKQPVPRDGGRHYVIIYNQNVPEGEASPVAWQGPIDASLVPALTQWIKINTIAMGYRRDNMHPPTMRIPLTHDETGRVRPDRGRGHSDIAMNEMMDQWGSIIQRDRGHEIPGPERSNPDIRERAIQVVDELRRRGIDPSAPVVANLRARENIPSYDSSLLTPLGPPADPTPERIMQAFVTRVSAIPILVRRFTTRPAREEAVEAIRQDINRNAPYHIPESVGRELVNRMMSGAPIVIDREVIDVSRHGDAPNRQLITVGNPESPQQSWARDRWDQSLAGRALAMHEGHRDPEPSGDSARSQLDMVQRQLQDLLESVPPGHTLEADVARRVGVLRDAERTLLSVMSPSSESTVRLPTNRRSRPVANRRWIGIDESSNIDDIRLASEADPDRNNRTE